MKYFTIAVLVFCVACNDGESINGKAAKDSTGTTAASDSTAPSPAIPATCNEEQAIAAIRKLPKIVAQQRYLDSLTKYKKSVAFMTADKTIDGRACYEISAGFNGDQRWENYYTFYVDKQDCSRMSVMDPIEGNIIPVQQWNSDNK